MNWRLAVNGIHSASRLLVSGWSMVRSCLSEGTISASGPLVSRSGGGICRGYATARPPPQAMGPACRRSRPTCTSLRRRRRRRSGMSAPRRGRIRPAPCPGAPARRGARAHAVLGGSAAAPSGWCSKGACRRASGRGCAPRCRRAIFRSRSNTATAPSASSRTGPATLRGRTVFALHPHQDRSSCRPTSWCRVPDGVPPRRAVLAANMETALNALWDAGAGPGDRIVVVGAGVVGLLVAAARGAAARRRRHAGRYRPGARRARRGARRPFAPPGDGAGRRRRRRSTPAPRRPGWRPPSAAPASRPPSSR